MDRIELIKKRRDKKDRKMAKKISKTIKRKLKEDFNVIFSRTPGGKTYRIAVLDDRQFSVFLVSPTSVAIIVNGMGDGLSREISSVLFELLVNISEYK